MAVTVGSARIDENGNAHGGSAGDQNAKEVSTQNWYKHSKGWRVLRAKDAAKAAKIAACMKAACANSNIGYDQYQRLTLYNEAQSFGFDVSKVTKKVECDCSSLVRVCLAYAGIKVGNFRTTDQAKIMLASGEFTELTGSKYTDQSAYLRAGDVLVTRTQGHTVVVLSDGPNAETTPTTAPTTSDTKGGADMKQVQVTGGTVNIRSGDSTKYGKVTTLKKGEKYEYVATSVSTGWHAIRYDGKIAWISNKYSTVK